MIGEHDRKRGSRRQGSSRGWAILSLVVTAGVWPGASWGLSICLNPVNQSGTGFSSTASDALLGSSPAGAPSFLIDSRFWNNLKQNDMGYAQQLKDSGNATAYDSGVFAMWRSPGTSALVLPWPGGTQNYKMMWGSFDSTEEANDDPLPADFFTRSANQPLIYIRGLSAWLSKSGQPTGTNSYAVLVYVDGDGTNRIGEYWLQRAPLDCSDPPAALGPDLTSHAFLRDDGTNFTYQFTRVPLSADSEANAVSGNYILWQGMTADRFVLRTEARATGDCCRRAVISGMQIVAECNTFPVVTVTATDAGEPSTRGVFTVTRSGSLSTPLTVYYAVGGTATRETDYYAEDLPGSVTIPAGSTFRTIVVRPKSDGLREDTETIVLALIARGDYVDGTPGGEGTSMNLIDEPAPTVTVAATDAVAGEMPGDTGTFTITRSGSASSIAQFPLTVRYAMSGSATHGIDYARLPGHVTLPAGVASVTVALTPHEDPTTEGPETAVLTVSPDAQYTVGNPGSATVSIADNSRAWTQSLPLIFGGYVGTDSLADFPVLIVLTPSRMGGYGAFAAGGADLRFQLPSGDCLTYEIEQWNTVGTSYVWVKLPSISGREDRIYMRWGNPWAATMQDTPAVWSNGYVGVWHLDAPDNGGLYDDSTGRGYDATDRGAARVPGRIAGALSFDAQQSGYLDTRNCEDLPFFTIAAWVRSPEAPTTGLDTGPLHRGNNYRINWNHLDGSACLGLESQGWYSAPYGGLSGDTWYYLAGTYDGQTLRAYRDGILVSATDVPSGAPDSEAGSLKIGRHATLDQYFTGTIDEVQVLSTAWSQARIANQYAVVTDTLIAWRGPPSLDADRDGDIDLDDFGAFQRCYTGPDRLLTANECLDADVDGDHCVTTQDLEEFVRCASGPGIRAAPNCLPTGE